MSSASDTVISRSITYLIISTLCRHWTCFCSTGSFDCHGLHQRLPLRVWVSVLCDLVLILNLTSPVSNPAVLCQCSAVDWELEGVEAALELIRSVSVRQHHLSARGSRPTTPDDTDASLSSTSWEEEEEEEDVQDGSEMFLTISYRCCIF